jgi:hypothetical protein
MGIRDFEDKNSTAGDGPARPRGNLGGQDDRASEGGGLGARWQARLRLQRDQRSGVRDRRLRPRPESDHPDRRLVI